MEVLRLSLPMVEHYLAGLVGCFFFPFFFGWGVCGFIMLIYMRHTSLNLYPPTYIDV